jgi:hypothetical protein
MSKLVKKVWTQAILIDIKPLKRNHVLTEEKHDMSSIRKFSPKISAAISTTALQSGVSVGSATKLLHIHIKLLLYLTLNLWIMKKDWGFVISLSVMCMMDFLILSWQFSQIRLILISRDMLTHKPTGIGVLKILMPNSNFLFPTKR